MIVVGIKKRGNVNKNVIAAIILNEYKDVLMDNKCRGIRLIESKVKIIE